MINEKDIVRATGNEPRCAHCGVIMDRAEFTYCSVACANKHTGGSEAKGKWHYRLVEPDGHETTFISLDNALDMLFMWNLKNLKLYSMNEAGDTVDLLYHRLDNFVDSGLLIGTLKEDVPSQWETMSSTEKISVITFAFASVLVCFQLLSLFCLAVSIWTVGVGIIYFYTATFVFFIGISVIVCLNVPMLWILFRLEQLKEE
jgi:hypothetical protein